MYRITTLLGTGFCPMAGRFQSYTRKLQSVGEVGQYLFPNEIDRQVTLEGMQDKLEYLLDNRDDKRALRSRGRSTKVWKYQHCIYSNDADFWSTLDTVGLTNGYETNFSKGNVQ